ncbi:hypothetical protein SCHPADRAFT_947615 [Schizopora paradoxa]|uniref:Uncharacterized protein n=1 Tax=Schizopora paradoxa TaxID=27342 RepID=A0A0H2RI94_9AGAM|nr:hypothetical protein SCHPADRAFT_947615 [Schizopora paradoxa]
MADGSIDGGAESSLARRRYVPSTRAGMDEKSGTRGGGRRRLGGGCNACVRLFETSSDVEIDASSTATVCSPREASRPLSIYTVDAWRLGNSDSGRWQTAGMDSRLREEMLDHNDNASSVLTAAMSTSERPSCEDTSTRRRCSSALDTSRRRLHAQAEGMGWNGTATPQAFEDVLASSRYIPSRGIQVDGIWERGP